MGIQNTLTVIHFIVRCESFPFTQVMERVIHSHHRLPTIRALIVTQVIILGAIANAQQRDSESSVDQPRVAPLILAHYMPWFTAKPANGRWGWHWTMNHFDPEKQTNGKREIASKYYPLIGPYDSGDPQVLEYHLLTMKIAGIDGVIVDWYGLTDLNDYAILHRNTTRLLEQCERLGMKFVICYEDQTIPALVKGDRIDDDERVSHASNEISWLGKYWFRSPSYVRFDGQPVLLSFGHAGLTKEEWRECLGRLSFPVQYYSQDIRREGAIGGFGWPSPSRGLNHVDEFLSQAKQWPDVIPVAFPRFVDIYHEANVSDGYPDLPDRDGATFRSTLTKAIASKSRMIQLATWNDWGEGTQIEPSREFGYRDLIVLQATRKRLTGQAMFRESDLEIPRRILELRRNGRATKQVDAAVQWIIRGEMGKVRSEFDAITP